MIRYEDADEGLVKVFLDIMEQRFPKYQYLNFKLVFDLKKRVKGGKIIIANIELASSKIKYFSQDATVAEGYDYIIFVDKLMWGLASDLDKGRIISHELRHVFIDEYDKPKIIGHEIEDFYHELKLNEDDPEWASKLVRLGTDVYDQEKEIAKEKANKKN